MLMNGKSCLIPIFKHVSHPLLTGVDSQVQMERMSCGPNFIKKKKNYCSFASSPLSNSLVSASLGAAKNTGWLPRPGKIRINMFSLRYPSEEAVQESTAKTDQTVWTAGLSVFVGYS